MNNKFATVFNEFVSELNEKESIKLYQDLFNVFTKTLGSNYNYKHSFAINNHSTRKEFRQWSVNNYRSICDDDSVLFIGDSIFNIKPAFELDGKRRIWALDLMIEKLLQNNIIYMVRNYEIGKNSKSYAFTEDFAKRLSEEDINIIRKISKQNEVKEMNKTERCLYDFLQKNIRLYSNKDKDMTISYLMNEYTLYLFNNNIVRTELYSKQIFPTQLMIRKFIDKIIYVSQSETTGRIYSSFNVLPSVIRKHAQLKYKGKWHNLVCTDLKCAQSFLLANIIKDDVFLKICTDDLYTYLLNHQPENDSCEENVFDEKTNKIFKQKYKRRTTRNEIKEEWQRFLYNSKNDCNSIIEIIMAHSDLKNTLNTIRQLKTDCKRKEVQLSDILQKAEADVFNKVWYENKEVCIPLCDSLYIIEEFKDKVFSKLKEEFVNQGYKINNDNITIE